jgi:hypothetical protein
MPHLLNLPLRLRLAGKLPPSPKPPLILTHTNNHRPFFCCPDADADSALDARDA